MFEVKIEVPGLERLAEAIEKLGSGRTAEKTQEKANRKPDEKKAAAEQEKEETPDEEITLEYVRAVLAEVTRAGKQKELKALLNSFNANKLTEVDPSDYGELVKKAGGL